MRAVLDTNIVVSALIWGGTPFTLFQAAIEGDVLLYTSPILLAELSDVLARPHLASRLERQRSSVEQALALYAMLAVSVRPASCGKIRTAGTRPTVAAIRNVDHILKTFGFPESCDRNAYAADHRSSVTTVR